MLFTRSSYYYNIILHLSGTVIILLYTICYYYGTEHRSRAGSEFRRSSASHEDMEVVSVCSKKANNLKY